MSHILHQELSDKLLGMAFTVHNLLGPGLLEAAYEEAFCVELSLSGIAFDRQKVYALSYKGYDIGGYVADIVVDNAVILELKSVQQLTPVMESAVDQLSRALEIAGGVSDQLSWHAGGVAEARHVWRRVMRGICK